MNYLAHLALSPIDDDHLFGNYVADSIRPTQCIGWSRSMIEGYELHLAIDKYTDAHPGFIAAKLKLKDHHKKYAPVVLDILNDHLLAKKWKQYYNIPFVEWEEHIYDRLAPYRELNLPLATRKLLDGLLDHRYLKVYESQEGIKDVLGRMDKRARFQSDFVSGAEHLYEDYEFFDSCFHSLYHDLCVQFDPSHDLITP